MVRGKNREVVLGEFKEKKRAEDWACIKVKDP